MTNVVIIGGHVVEMRELGSRLSDSGFLCSIVPDGNGLFKRMEDEAPKLVLINMNGSATDTQYTEITRKIKREGNTNVIALVARDSLVNIDSSLALDDFVVEPWDAVEVAVRIKRMLRRTNGVDGGNLIKAGNMVIDQDRCEVSVKGRQVTLTFKEYELLKFMASNRGRVYTREALLDEVWGYDYFGGDRTVDVHIRRLRSKIEDSGLTFIETVRNIGYRFKKD